MTRHRIEPRPPGPLANTLTINRQVLPVSGSSFEGVSTDHRIVTAKIRLSLRKNAKRTATTKHYDWALLNNRHIRDKYVLELRKRFETLQEKTEKVHQTTNMKISSMHTSRQQRNAFQPNSKLNIESHGKI